MEGELVVLLAVAGHEADFGFADGVGGGHLVAAILHSVEGSFAGCEDLLTVPTVVVAIGGAFGLNEPEAVGRLGAFNIDSQGVEVALGCAVLLGGGDEVGIAILEVAGRGALDHEAGERGDLVGHAGHVSCEVGGDGLGVLSLRGAVGSGTAVGNPVFARAGVEEVDHLVGRRCAGEVEFVDAHGSGVGVGQDVHVLIVGGGGHAVDGEGEVCGVELADESIGGGLRLRDFVGLSLGEGAVVDVGPLLVGVGDVERAIVLAHPGGLEGELVAIGALDGRSEVLPGGVGLVAVAVEGLGKHLDVGLVVGVVGGFGQEEGTVGLALFGLHDGVVGYAARSKGFGGGGSVGRKIPEEGFLFEENLVARGGNHGASGFGGVDVVAHHAILVGIEVADGGFAILFCDDAGDGIGGIVVDRGEDHIRLLVVGIVGREGVGHETSGPVFLVGPVGADIAVPVVVFATVEGKGVGTEEAFGEGAGVAVTDVVGAGGGNGGEVGGAVGGGGAFGLFEHLVETVGGDGAGAALEGFEGTSAAGVKAFVGHGHEEAGAGTVGAAEGEIAVLIDGEFIVGHANIFVGAGVDFAPEFELGGLEIVGQALGAVLRREGHGFERAPGVVATGRLGHYVALLEREVVVLVGHVLRFGGQREEVELVDGEVELSICGFGTRGVDVGVVAAQCLVESGGIAALVHRPSGFFERSVVAEAAAGGRIADVGEEVLGEIGLLELGEAAGREVRQEVFRNIEFAHRLVGASEVDILELIGGEVERFDVGEYVVEGVFRLCVGRSEHIVVEINVADGGHLGEVGVFDLLRGRNEFPHALFAGDLDDPALRGGDIDGEGAVFRQIVHLPDVLAVVFVVDEDDGPVFAGHFRGVLGGEGEGDGTCGRGLDEGDAVLEVVGGFFGQCGRGGGGSGGCLGLCALGEGSHQQACGEECGKASLSAECSRETANG